MFNKVKTVQTLPGLTLQVGFLNGESKQYFVGPLIEKYEAFGSLLTTKGLFEQAKVDAGGYGVSWNDEIDLSCDELYHNGVS